MGGSTVEASTQSFPAAHSSGRGRGGFWLRLAGLPLLAGVGVYLGLGAYIANRVSRPIRQTLHTTPAEFGLAYENVAFTSTVDNIPLRGWLIGARDAKTIIFVHSKDGIRMSARWACLRLPPRSSGATTPC